MAEQHNPIRLSSFADLRAVKGEIKTAPVLAMGNGPVTKVEVGAAVKIPQITAEDSIDSIVVKFIRENPNLNEDEIMAALIPVIQMPDKITAAISQLYRAGLIMQTPVLVNGSTLTVYRAKHNALTSLTKAQDAGSITPKMFKLPDVAIVDPAGRIIFEQGMDIAIWKIMQDHEWRSLEDIALLLHTYGFHTHAVKTRVRTLLDVGTGGIRWFETTRKNKQRRKNPEPYYKLRLGVDCPKLGILSVGKGVAEEPEEKSGDEAVDAILSGNSVFSVPAQVPEAVAETNTQPQESAVEYDTEVREGDHFPVVLWKVMIGKQDLRVRDLGKLVEPYGFDEGMCASIMSVWVHAGYLNKRVTKEECDMRPVNVYTLRDKPMPTFTPSGRSKFATLPEVTPTTLGSLLAARATEAAIEQEKVWTPGEVSTRAESQVSLDKDMLIREGDSLPLCILKIIKSAGSISMADLVMMLDSWGFIDGQVYGAVATLRKRGLIEQVPGEDGKINPRTGSMRLNGDVPVSFVTTSRTPVAKVRKLSAAAALEDQTRSPGSLFDSVAFAEQAAPVSKPPVETPKATVPLVRHLVMIKGVEFTLAEVDQIIAEMNTLKLFAWVDMPVRVVKATFEVKGIVLTPEELNEVLKSMK
jgi:hypothetical protein